MGKIEDILEDFQKKFGLKPTPRKDIQVFSTGFKEINAALGVGGIPRGRTTEISGTPGTGKTVLAYHMIREAQSQGAIVMYVDAERAFDKHTAKRLGVDIESLMIVTPLIGEYAIQAIHTNLSYKLVDLIIVDSMPALLPLEELRGESKTLTQTKLIGTFFKALMEIVETSNTALVCLNQVRHDFKLGGATTPFNQIFGYFASVRIHLSRVKSITRWRRVQAYIIEANIYKNNLNQIQKVNFELKVNF